MPYHHPYKFMLVLHVRENRRDPAVMVDGNDWQYSWEEFVTHCLRQKGLARRVKLLGSRWKHVTGIVSDDCMPTFVAPSFITVIITLFMFKLSIKLVLELFRALFIQLDWKLARIKQIKRYLFIERLVMKNQAHFDIWLDLHYLGLQFTNCPNFVWLTGTVFQTTIYPAIRNSFGFPIKISILTSWECSTSV